MMRMWLDCEFNGSRGWLISAALIAEDGKEWYEVASDRATDPWVRLNVLPILRKQMVPLQLIHDSLYKFLKQYEAVHIVVDHPADLRYFADLLEVGSSGEQMRTPPLTFELRTDLPGTAGTSLVPHNALEDAKALRRSHLDKEDEDAFMRNQHGVSGLPNA